MRRFGGVRRAAGSLAGSAALGVSLWQPKLDDDRRSMMVLEVAVLDVVDGGLADAGEGRELAAGETGSFPVVPESVT